MKIKHTFWNISPFFSFVLNLRENEKDNGRMDGRHATAIDSHHPIHMKGHKNKMPIFVFLMVAAVICFVQIPLQYE